MQISKVTFSKIIIYLLFPLSLLAAYLLLGDTSIVGSLGVSLALFVIGSVWLWVQFKLDTPDIKFFGGVLIVLYMLNAIAPLFTTAVPAGNFLFAMILITLFDVSVINPNWWENGVASFFITNVTNIFISKVIGIFETLENVMKFPPAVKSRINIKSVISSVGVFMIFGVPVTLVVLGLLANSSEIFSEVLLNIDLGIGSLEVNILRIFVAAMLFVWLTTELVFLRKQSESKAISLGESVKSPTILTAIASSVLITTLILNIFYLVFIVIQIQFDLNNLQQLIVEQGITSYSELAVSRFWDLIMVAIINLGLILVAARPWRAASARSAVAKLLIKLNATWLIINTLLLVFSSWQRLNLYIGGYGLSHKRFAALIFLPLLVLLVGLIYWGFVRLQMRTALKYGILMMICYAAFWHIVPETYLVNKLNYQLDVAGQIQVFDPTYTIPLNRFNINSMYSRKWEHHNDISDADGSLIALQLVEEDELVVIEKEILIEYVETYLSRPQVNWRDWNVMDYLIRVKADELGISPAGEMP